MRLAGHLDIGPLRFALRRETPGAVRYSDPAYGGLFSEPVGRTVPVSRDPGSALIELPVDVVRRAVPPPSGAPLWQAGGHWAVWDDGPDLAFHVGLTAPASRRYSCRVARDVTRAELALPLAAGPDDVLDAPLRYPLDQILSWGALARIGGALLHAAVAVKDGRGHVFTGRSGAGKSTLSGLLLAEGWRILNDDRVVVFRRGGAWRVAGTPWHGSGRFAEAAEVPLAGIHFLQKASACRTESMSASQVRLALLDVAAVPWFEDSWAQGILDGLDRLAGDVDISRFHFTKTPEAAQVLARERVPA
ncbi:MAG: hypothetical protein AB7V22_00255 [Kiritimatiellia bacterium]